MQVGIRGPMYGEDEDFAFQRAHDVLMIDIVEAARDGVERTCARIRERVEGPVYVTFDIDAVDPAFAPGTGTPEVGGLTSLRSPAARARARRPRRRRRRRRRGGAALRRPGPDHVAARREPDVRAALRHRATLREWYDPACFMYAGIPSSRSCSPCSRPRAAAQEPTRYRISFPAPEHHYAEVEVTFPSAPATLEARMSRSSPGRYAMHEYAKNVFDVRAVRRRGPRADDRRGPTRISGTSPATTARCASPTRSSATTSTARISAIDPTHAHMNMPATFMWAARLRRRARCG